ncbi:MAG: hypothetical protein HXY24_18710 [Rubrivivax sp.]|nr:hypothetical protein [Rubrivivax sp.]
MSGKQICQLSKNTRETIWFRLGEFKGHKFIDMQVFITEDGKDPTPTKKGLAISPQQWPQFRAALEQVEAAMIEQGWLDRDDLVLGEGLHPPPEH